MASNSIRKSKLPLEKLLQEVVERYAKAAPHHQWINERDRWHELVACILFTFGGQAGENARRAGSILSDLDLLNIEVLTNLPLPDGNTAQENTHLTLMRNILVQMGFTEDQAMPALQSILRIAQDLHTHYGGRIQSYLRQYGERMLANLEVDFPKVSSSDEFISHAFAIWLQNVLTMPIFVDTASTRQFCEEAGCTLDELHQTADRMDINASLLDDLLDLWAQEREELRSVLSEKEDQDD
jgi:hypothetical protein